MVVMRSSRCSTGFVPRADAGPSAPTSSAISMHNPSISEVRFSGGS